MIVKEVRTCWPKHDLGPVPKGKNMDGLGTRYSCNLSSINRSGSNSCATDILSQIQWIMWTRSQTECTVGTPEICSAMHHEDAELDSASVNVMSISTTMIEKKKFALCGRECRMVSPLEW
jgi:hypothetical protein